MIGNLFASVAMKVSAGIIGLLLIFAGIQSYRLSERTEERDLARAEFHTEQAKHAVSLASIESLMKALSEQNLAIQGLKADADQRVKAAQEALGAARSANNAQAGQIDRLRSSASQKPSDEPCEVSEKLKEATGL